MPPLALALRCLLILAFCLDGSTALWRASAMAGDMTHHAVSGERLASDHHGLADANPADDDCGESPAVGQDESSHENCDCSITGCYCACGFATTAAAGSVPFAAQHRLVSAPPVHADQDAIRSARSAVFRPPIG